MRWIIYIAALALTLMAPVKRTDVGMLQPVEVISLQRRGEELLLTTDTQDRGMGKNLEKAVENLKETTAGAVCLDTAEYLLVSEDAISTLDKLSEFLKPSVKVSLIDARGKVKEASEYLRVHPDYEPLKKIMSK